MIEPMKKVSVVLLNKEKEDALKALRKIGLVHLQRMEGSSEKLNAFKEYTNNAVISESILGEIKLDKKTLANVLGIHSDSDHLSVDLFNEIKQLPEHSHIEIVERDKDFFASGFVVTSIVNFKNMVRIRFNEDFLPLFTIWV